MSSSATLRILSLLLLTELCLSVTKLYVTPGSTLILHCVPSSHPPLFEPSFSWTRMPQQDTLPTHQKGEFLSIDKIALKDTGVYECVTEGSIEKWGNKRKMRLKMIFFVDLADVADIQQEELVDTMVGDSVTLSCPLAPEYSPTSLSHDPAPSVTWHKDVMGQKEELKLRPRSEERAEGPMKIHWALSTSGQWSIKVNNVTTEDSGMYHCHWEENGEQKNHTVELVVKVPPTPLPSRCHSYTTPWEPCVNQSRSGKAILTESLMDFSMHIYSLLSKSHHSTNLLFSPFSIAEVLTHLLLGARGDTRTSLEQALHLPPLFHCSHTEMRNLRQELKDNVEIASQIYYSPELELEQTFINQSEQLYDSCPQKLTNSSQLNVDMINNWVAEKTHQRITHLVESVSSSVQLILVNAIYFNGKWKVKFQKNNEPAEFVTASGDLVLVPVLYSSNYKMVLWYSKELKAQVGVLPLSGQARLFLLLPTNDLKGLESIMNERNVMELAKTTEQMTPEPIEVTLPVIKLDIRTDLMDLLENMGLSDLFGSPNLCGLSAADVDPPLAVSEAQHRSFLSLTESGVEAAGITTLSFSRNFRSFSVLRPFLFILWSDQTNCPLFMGRVVKP